VNYQEKQIHDDIEHIMTGNKVTTIRSMSSIRDLDRYRGLSGVRALTAAREIINFVYHNIMNITPFEVKTCMEHIGSLTSHLNVEDHR